MAKRRPLFDRLEDRLCMAAPVLQTSFRLPQDGPWTPTVYRSSPLMVDIFGTGKDNLIAVAAGAKLIAYGSNADGSASPVVTYQVPGGVADIKSTPIVVTDPRTGQKELFAAMGRDETNSGSLEDGRVFGWDLRTGQLLPGWAQGVSSGRNVSGFSGVYGALTSGDLDGDGVPEIVASSFSHEVTAYKLDGTILWRWTNDDTVLSGAVIGDIDRDGHPEVVVGGDSSEGVFFHAGGFVNILTDTGHLKYRTFIPGEVTWSSPVLADLNNNGYLDIVIGTGLNFDETNFPGSRALGNNVYAIDPFGQVLPGWPYHTTGNDAEKRQVLAGPAVADIDGNGQLDVVVLDRAGFVHVIQPNGKALPGFEGGRATAPGFATNSLPDNYASPIIADVLGTGSAQIIVSAGPFLAAFDKAGNRTLIATTGTSPGGTTPEGIDAAAVVGHFNGGSGWTLAYVSYNAALQNRPDQVSIYKVSPTSVVPPWPTLRRTVAGEAIYRSAAYDRRFVTGVYNAAVGTAPSRATLNSYVAALGSNTQTLLGTARAIFSSPAARAATVQQIFQALLGHAADAFAVSVFSDYLATNTEFSMQVLVASSPEFAQRAGGSVAREVVQLYRGILGRSPTQGEIDFWVSTGLGAGAMAPTFINSQEGINLRLGRLYDAAFGAGARNSIGPDSAAAFTSDLRQGVREEEIGARVLASNGVYAATNLLARYIRSLYQDILGRAASPTDVAIWLQQVDGGVQPLALPGLFLNSLEGRIRYVQQEFQALLGRGVDAGTAATLANYPFREALILTIVGSPEYYNRAGGTDAGYVQALFRDLGGIGIDQTIVNAFLARINAGFPRVGVAQEIIYGGSLYNNKASVDELMLYLPDEAQGVLRSGALSPTDPSQPVNPSPFLVNYLMGLRVAGFSDDQIIALLLTSPDYFSRISYYRGLLRSPGIRI